MRYVTDDKKYRFRSGFDTVTGTYFRTGILDQKGRDTGVDPFMASYPHLIDVGIMGHCIHGKTGLCAKAGIGCYQSGMVTEQAHMSVLDFRTIARQSRGRCHQFALGGRGDPDQHPQFALLLQICRENGLVPNFTTSGYGMTPEIAKLCRQYCGAVAVSWYRSSYTHKAIELLLQAGVRTNIHYVLGSNSIDEAIERLQNSHFPKGINGVIFLLHKPVGQGSEDNVLSPTDPRVQQFFSLLDKPYPFKIGMDSCCVPGAIQFCSKVAPQALDTCEGARFSCYIGPDMVMVPCSFDQSRHYAVDLRTMTIEEGWNSPEFDRFRSILQNACPDCEKRQLCMGGCPLCPDIVLCHDKNKKRKD